MSKQPASQAHTTARPVLTLFTRGILQRQCACGQHTSAGGECEACKKGHEGTLQRSVINQSPVQEVPPIVHEVLSSSGQPLDQATRAFMEPRFGHDFSHVRVHTDARAAQSAQAVNALAYTVGRDLVFGDGMYATGTMPGKRLLAHELTHVVQQSPFSAQKANLEVAGDSSPEEHSAEVTADAIMAGRTFPPIAPVGSRLYRRAAPYIRRITVHLTPPQSADLEWQGTPPADAPGNDHFTVSTGKGYGDPGDPPGTCRRDCCDDPMTQCAPPWNQPGSVGACCTYYGNNFWTGTPRPEHNGWLWWTPIQPYYSSRGIALHQHTDVTGQPIGHGCVRMDEPNARRIYEYSNGRRTNVTMDGRAAPVACEPDRRCTASGGAGSGGARGDMGAGPSGNQVAALHEAVPGLEGLLT